MKNKPFTDEKDIEALINEAEKRGLFNAVGVSSVNSSYSGYITSGRDTAKYNQYAICNSPGDWLEVKTYILNKKGEKIEGRYITIYKNGEWSVSPPNLLKRLSKRLWKNL